MNAPTQDPMGDILDHADTLVVNLVWWASRDDSKAQPRVRQAANDALAAIDALLRELHQVRGRLVDEIRRSDDATAARIDALLARRPGGAR